jgi:lipoprotein-anchoring transpeptidase ErfK/SrfK
MHDIDERLTQLGGSLEAAAEVRSPTQVRSRGEQIQVAHRRRMVTVTAVTAAVAVIGVGSLVALRPTGHKGAPVGPGTVGTSSTSPTSPTAAASEHPIAIVDLTHDMMKVYDGHGQVVKTIPVTGGSAAHQTHVGVFAITAKQQDAKIQSGPTSSNGDTYEMTVHWVVTLDGGPLLYAVPSASASFGMRNNTHGDIEMSTESAQWLYDHVAIGDRIQIQ